MAYKLNWNGQQYEAYVRANLHQNLGVEANSILNDLHSELHVVTGDMVNQAFAEVNDRGSLIELAFGSRSGHTYYHEISAKNYAPHPQIRTIGDRHQAAVKQAAQRSA